MYKICTQSAQGLGRDGPDRIQYRKKIRNIAIQVLASLKKGEKKSHLWCVIYFRCVGGRECSFSPASSSMGRTNSKTPISQHLTLPNRKSFPFPLPFFFSLSLFKQIGFFLSCSFFFFRAFSRLGWDIFVGFLFFPWLCRGSRLGQGLGLLLVGFLFIHLFHLHPPVLKPDFDLPLGEIENPSHLIPTVPG